MFKQKIPVWKVRVFLANQTRPDQPTFLFTEAPASPEGFATLAENVNACIQTTEYFRRNTVDYAVAYVPEPINVTDEIGFLLRARASYRKVPNHVAAESLARVIKVISDRVFLMEACEVFEKEARRRFQAKGNV